jgi:hypothetical protein
MCCQEALANTDKFLNKQSPAGFLTGLCLFSGFRSPEPGKAFPKIKRC